MKTSEMGLGLGTALALCLLVCGCKEEKKGAGPEVKADTRLLVKVAPVREKVDFYEIADIQGTLRAKFSAAISARVPGALEVIYADEGQRVTNGASLFQVDRVNLENKVRLARDDRNVAAAAMKEAEAAQAQALAASDKAKIDVGRMKALYEDDRAVTKDAWERADLQAKSSAATLKRAQAAVETARVKIVQADTALSVALKTLEDSHGVAPFAGIITRKLKDKGDYVAPGTAIFTMDNPDVYEICFSMNARDYERVKVGETRVLIGQERYPVTYRSPSVHPVTRTFEIRITVPRKPAWAPGMIFNARCEFRHYQAPGVPSSAVALRGKGHQVFISREGRARGIDVEVGNTWNGWTEIRKAEGLKGAQVVTEGMLLLNDGDAIRVKGE